ncbi:MAG: hypothetical protein VB824_09035 [Dehalococcoidia bacterium]
MTLALVAARAEELAAVLRIGGWRPWKTRGRSAWRRRRSPDGTLAYQRRDHTVSAILTGAGKDQTERGMDWLLNTEKPASILSVGFSGACSPNLDIGDLVLSTSTQYLGGKPFDWEPGSLNTGNDEEKYLGTTRDISADRKLLEKTRDTVEIAGIDFMTAPTLTVDSLVRTAGLSAWLGETYGIAAVDRESYWVAAAASNAGIPCLIVRAITYGVNDTLPGLAAKFPDTPSGGRFGPVFRHSLKHPGEVWRFRKSLRSARNSVANLAGVLAIDGNLTTIV